MIRQSPRSDSFQWGPYIVVTMIFLTGCALFEWLIPEYGLWEMLRVAAVLCWIVAWCALYLKLMARLERKA